MIRPRMASDAGTLGTSLPSRGALVGRRRYMSIGSGKQACRLHARVAPLPIARECTQRLVVGKTRRLHASARSAWSWARHADYTRVHAAPGRGSQMLIQTACKPLLRPPQQGVITPVVWRFSHDPRSSLPMPPPCALDKRALPTHSTSCMLLPAHHCAAAWPTAVLHPQFRPKTDSCRPALETCPFSPHLSPDLSRPPPARQPPPFALAAPKASHACLLAGKCRIAFMSFGGVDAAS